MPTKRKGNSSLKKKKKLPSRSQWKQFFKVLAKKEKIIFFALVSTAFLSGLSLGVNFYFENTAIVPARGGIYREGLIGQPRFMNPLYLSTQDVDRDIVEVLFSGLLKYNEKGELLEDLAMTYEIKEEGKIFEVMLKDNLFWHDGQPLTAQDVVFTLNLVQEPQTQSPLRVKWLGIVVEKVSDRLIRFRLPKKYSAFLENLTLKILPKHIFEDIPPNDLPWQLMSQKYLVGSGPFKFKEVEENKSGYVKKLTLVRNELYYSTNPHLDELSFIFYQDTESLLKAAKFGEIDGFSLTDPKYFKGVENGFRTYLLSIPRYFAVFFNLKVKESVFAQNDLRKAVAFSINKNELLQEIFSGKGSKVNSPILPDFFGFVPATETYEFNKEKAQEILEGQGFKISQETQKREKTVMKEAALSFKRNLVYKSQGEDVQRLQECLAKDPEVYPEGIINGYFGAKTKAAVIRFQEKYAQDILYPIGLKKGTGDVKPMTREKLNEICFARPTEIVPFKIILTTGDKFPLPEIAKILKKQWEEIGAEVEINEVPLADLQTTVLAKRDFEVLLFGEALGSIPDPFPFWHSSQKDYPGLNIPSYESKTADQLLEKAREATDRKKQQENLEKFQKVLLEDLPATFLVCPDYVYMLSPIIKGFNVEKITEPAKRFSTIENWFVKTKRVWQ